MFKERLTSLIAIALVGLVLTGCAGKKTPPAATDDGNTTAQPTTPAEQPAPADFGADGLRTVGGAVLRRAGGAPAAHRLAHADAAELRGHGQVVQRRLATRTSHCFDNV